MKARDLLSILSQLKQFGLLNTQFTSQALAMVKDQVQILTTPEIVLFTMIYTSPDARSSMNKDSNFDEKLDFILSKHIDQLTSDEFGSICNSIARGDSPYSDNEEVLFQSFLKESISQCEQWLATNSFSLKDLPAVAFAYSYIINDLENEKVDSLQNKLEQAIFDNA